MSDFVPISVDRYIKDRSDRSSRSIPPLSAEALGCFTKAAAKALDELGKAGELVKAFKLSLLVTFAGNHRCDIRVVVASPGFPGYSIHESGLMRDLVIEDQIPISDIQKPMMREVKEELKRCIAQKIASFIADSEMLLSAWKETLPA